MEINLLLSILVCILFSAMFSGIEIAFIATNKLHIEVQGKQGGLAGKILSKFASKPSEFISTTLIGNNLSLVVYGIFMAMLLEPWLINVLPDLVKGDQWILLFQTIISTVVVLFTAEYIPKSLFLTNPYRFLKVLSMPFLLIFWILSPIVYIVAMSSKFFITKILRLDYSEDKPVFGLTDLNNYIKKIVETDAEENDQELEVDARFFNNALDFKTVKVRECMVPRTEIVAVDINDGVAILKSQFIESGHSKILIYDDSVDEIIGYCHSLEMFKKPETIQEILTKISIVPETMAANELLIQLITERRSLALVVDEYGGTSGIVSLEDIIEEIFGEIKDEHDDEDLLEEKIDAHQFLLSARHEIDYLNETHELSLPEGEYDTLGGLILSINENLPDEGQLIEVPGFTIEILKMEEARIEKVKLKKEPTPSTI